VDATGTTTNQTVAFSETPDDGELLVVLVFSTTGTGSLTPPSGWDLIFTASANTARVHKLYTRIANSESNSYEWAWSAVDAVGFRFTAGASVAQYDTELTTAGTSSAECANPDMDVVGPAYAIAGVSHSQGVAGHALDNDFTWISSSSRNGYGHRAFPTSENGQNCTFSWTGEISQNVCGSLTIIGL
jgi:hypothetical protein